MLVPAANARQLLAYPAVDTTAVSPTDPNSPQRNPFALGFGTVTAASPDILMAILPSQPARRSTRTRFSGTCSTSSTRIRALHFRRFPQTRPVRPAVFTGCWSMCGCRRGSWGRRRSSTRQCSITDCLPTQRVRAIRARPISRRRSTALHLPRAGTDQFEYRLQRSRLAGVAQPAGPWRRRNPDRLPD